MCCRHECEPISASSLHCRVANQREGVSWQRLLWSVMCSQAICRLVASDMLRDSGPNRPLPSYENVPLDARTRTMLSYCMEHTRAY